MLKHRIVMAVGAGLAIALILLNAPWWAWAVLLACWSALVVAGSFRLQWQYHLPVLFRAANESHFAKAGSSRRAPTPKRFGAGARRLCEGAVSDGAREGRVAITFDDGPHPEVTPRVLRLLADHGAKATFFCIGKQVAAHPDLVRDIVAQGHTIGNHSYSHDSTFGFKSTKAVVQELEMTEQAVQGITGLRMRLFRPPFGVTNPQIARAVALRKVVCVGWSIRSLDTTRRSTEQVCERVERSLNPDYAVGLVARVESAMAARFSLRRNSLSYSDERKTSEALAAAAISGRSRTATAYSGLKSGEVILLHDTSLKCVEVLERSLELLRTQGLSAVTVDRLLNIEPYRE